MNEIAKVVGEVGKFELTDDDYFISDPHFYHKNVIKYCNRPFCCQHSMNEVLIMNWNDAVKSANTRIFVLGDVAFGSKNKIKRVLDRLNGYKIVIKGNHDAGRNTLVSLGFQEAYLSAECTYKGKTVLMRHIPDKDRHMNYDLHLCGHVHQHWTKTENIINVGVDVWDLKPQKLKFMIENADARQAAMPEQRTLLGAWEERNEELIKDMYEREKK